MFHSSFALALLALAPASTLQAPASDVRAWEHQSSDIPVDPRIHFGALANGLRYAWMDNAEPKQRCYLRLHVDVGSLAESEAERGMAHYLEHMAFNGSKRFPAGSLVEWFQRHGMSFGADTNASTGFSQTIYQLDLPVSDEKTITEGLQVLRDYADGLLIENKEVDFERGVIDGEERERDSAGMRVLKETLRLQMSGTRVAERLPIGIKAARDKFDAAALRKFYSTWYRPDSMTLLVVGDLQGRNPQALIEKEFKDVARPSSPRPAEPSPGKLDNAHPFYAIFEKEMPAVSIGVQMATPFRDRADNRAEVAANLPLAIACSMQNTRFAELAKKADTAFLAASISDTHENATGMGVRLEEGLELGIQCRAEKWQAALTSAEHELRRAIEFGFEEKELAEARADVLRGLEESVAREKTRSSTSWLGDLLDASENRSVPTNALTRREIAKPLVEALDVATCQKALAKAWGEGRLVIGSGGPLDLGADGPKLLKETYEKARAEKLEARAKTEDKPFAYGSDPKQAGAVASRAHNDEFDFEDVTFANGVRLRVKKTDFKQKQILVSAQLGEGELSLDPARKAVGRIASGIVEACGFKEHSQDDLRRLNAGKEVGYSFAVGENHFSLDGATTQEDLQRELELLCAQITSPGWRSEGLTTFQKQIAVAFDGMKHQHNWALASKFMPALYSNDPRKAWVPQEALEAVTMPAVSAWIEGEFANAPLDVALVGDLDVEAAVKAAAQTFGALPKRRAAQMHDDRRKAIALKTGLRENYEVDTTVPKTLVVISYPTTDGRDAALRRNLRFLGLVLNDRLRIDVREKLGAAYSPGAGSMANDVIEGDGMLMINAMADPDKVEALVDACKAAAQKLATDGVTDEEVERLRAPQLASYRDGLRTNGYWLRALTRFHTSATALEELRTVGSSLENLKAEALTPLAKRYLPAERASIAVIAPVAIKKDGASSEASAPKKKD